MPDITETLKSAASTLRDVRKDIIAPVSGLPTAKERNIVRRRAKALRKVALQLEVLAHDAHLEDKRAALSRIG